MLRIIATSALLCLGSLASAQTQKYEYETQLPKSALATANTALSVIGVKHALLEVLTSYRVTVKNGEEQVSPPSGLIVLRCSGDSAGREVDLTVPSKPEVSQDKKTRLAAEGYAPVGAARTIAILSTTHDVQKLLGVAGSLVSMLNEACSERYSNSVPTFAISLWSKSAPDKYLLGVASETGISMTYTPISVKRLNEILSMK